MRAILVVFDSLSRRYLPPYGNTWVQAPHFTRLARDAATFDRCFVGSMPCMPARRELHTGRYNFLHRSWGPLEPFDDSMPALLAQHGVYTHLVSDHYHYWEDGGATYHNRYSSWEGVRGQEGDRWKGQVADPPVPPHAGCVSRQDLVNRQYQTPEANTPQAQTFALGLEFLRTNHRQDRWLLQIECFDPHPPFCAPDRFRDLYPDPDGSSEIRFDWPHYAPVSATETPALVARCRREYAALVSQCDHSLGQVLRAMDEYGLWNDTLLIVTTDHGFLLGEHGWWAFCRPPFYDEVARKPLFIWDPRAGVRGQRRQALVQTHDLPATLLEYFGVARPPAMQGQPLAATVATDAAVRAAGLFGVFGGHVNCTDGRYVYMRAPAAAANQPLFNYTLLPTHMREPFSVTELAGATLAPPFGFSKGCPLLRVPARPFMQQAFDFGNLLYDLAADPEQQRPLADPAREAELCAHLRRLLRENEAPTDQFIRLGLD